VSELENAILKVLSHGGWKTGSKILNEIELKQRDKVTAGALYSTLGNLVSLDEIRKRKLTRKSRTEFCLTPKGCRQKNKNESATPKKDFVIA
jgi:hypothetical protein